MKRQDRRHRKCSGLLLRLVFTVWRGCLDKVCELLAFKCGYPFGVIRSRNARIFGDCASHQCISTAPVIIRLGFVLVQRVVLELEGGYAVHASLRLMDPSYNSNAQLPLQVLEGLFANFTYDI